MTRSTSALTTLALLAALASACDDVPLGGAAPGHVVLDEIPDSPSLCDVRRAVFDVVCIGCHVEGGLSPAFDGDNLLAVVGGASVRYEGRTLVVPGDPAGSLLYRKITGTQADDEGARMPQGMGALLPEQISLVERWIATGARLDCDAADEAEAPPAAPPPAEEPAPLPETVGAVDACDVAPMFTVCLDCHGRGDDNGPVLDLLGLQTTVVGGTSTRYPGATWIVPGDPAASLLFRKISGTQGGDEGSRMPLGGPYFTPERIALVEEWIASGAAVECDAGGGAAATCDEAAGDVTIATPEDAAAFAARTCVSGDLVVEGSAGDLALPSLASVTGSVRIGGLSGDGRVSLPGLTSVGGSVEVVANPGLAALDAPLLGSIAGTLRLADNAALASIDLGALGVLGGDLLVESAPLLPTCVVDEIADRLKEADHAGEVLVEGTDDDADCG